MNIVLKGKDYEQIEECNFELDILCPEKSTTFKKAEDYFERYKSLFGHEILPYNMGIYQTTEKDKEILKATQYIGVLPLLKLPKKSSEENRKKSSKDIIKILSRFNISPTEMLEAVLAGDDYYENPDMLKFKSYTISEWKDQKINKKNNQNVIFGLLNGVEQIDLFSASEGAQDVNVADLGIVEAYGAFEIIDFVNKAKNLCKKNLKKQFCRIEENLNCKVKGRILVQKQIKYNVSKGQEQKVYCAYNKMSENIKENQIVKYALILCARKSGIGEVLSEDIRTCMNALAGVTLKKCSVSDFVGLKNNAAYRQYKETLIAAKKVICRYSLSYNGAEEKSDDKVTKKSLLNSGKVLPYYINMNILFEYYCRAIFKQAINNYNLENEKKNIKLELESSAVAERQLFSEDSKISNYYMKTYIPDIVIKYTYSNGKNDNEKKEGIAAVFDAKNSDVENGDISKRERTHQILFYMKVLGCNNGGLISPATRVNLENSILKDNILKDNICINNAKVGKKEESEKTKLYYIPLVNCESKLNRCKEYFKVKKDFDVYIKIVEMYLKDIAKTIETVELKKSKGKVKLSI